MAEYKAGDRVRVTQTLEGVISEVDHNVIYLIDGKGILLGVVLGDAWAVEVLEPEYEKGAMYVDADGGFYAYWPNERGDETPWAEPGSHHHLRLGVPMRPLRKLVPEGGSE